MDLWIIFSTKKRKRKTRSGLKKGSPQKLVSFRRLPRTVCQQTKPQVKVSICLPLATETLNYHWSNKHGHEARATTQEETLVKSSGWVSFLCIPRTIHMLLSNTALHWTVTVIKLPTSFVDQPFEADSIYPYLPPSCAF